MMGTRARTNSQNNSRISYAAHMFCSRITCSTCPNRWLHMLFYGIVKETLELTDITDLKILKGTRIRAIGSCPVCKNCAISLRICFSCRSLLFCSSLIREIAKLKQVLLQNTQYILDLSFPEKCKDGYLFTSTCLIIDFDMKLCGKPPV